MATNTTRRRALRRRAEYVPSAEAAQREIRRAQRRRTRRRRRNALLIALLLALALGAATFYYCFDVVVARGGGMTPTIEGGSVVLCARQSFMDQLRGIIPEQQRRIGHDSLVLVKAASEDETDEGDGVLLIRRVAAMGGDVIDLAAGELILNESSVIGEAGDTDRVYPITVPDGWLFVMGDHRGLSIDSRVRAFGYVRQSDVVGRPLAVIWPVFAIGAVR